MFRKTRKELPVADDTTLISAGTQICGDVRFTGRLHVDGSIRGHVRGEGARAILTLSERAKVTGELHAQHIVIDGSVFGDITAIERLELAGNAHVEGNVWCALLEISAGARINGNVMRRVESTEEQTGPAIDKMSIG